MTTNMIHDYAERWLPIPLPPFEDCPPTVQATLADPRVVGAQEFFQMAFAQMANRPAPPREGPRPHNRKRHHR